MGRLTVMVDECKYKETDRHLKEHFINGLNTDGKSRNNKWYDPSD